MKTTRELLYSIGLTKEESFVYETLLTASSFTPTLLSIKTKIPRTSLYRSLLSLSVKGLVSEIIKGKRKVYKAESPKQLESLLREQHNELDLLQKQLSTKLPQLVEVFKKSSLRSQASFFEGDESVTNIYRDQVLEKGYEKLAFANIRMVTNLLPKEFIEYYQKSKQNQKINTRIIAPDTKEDREMIELTYRSIQKKYRPEIKFLSAQVFPYEGDISVYGKNKLSAINLRSNNPIGVIVEDQTLHDMFKAMFNIIWNTI